MATSNILLEEIPLSSETDSDPEEEILEEDDVRTRT